MKTLHLFVSLLLATVGTQSLAAINTGGDTTPDPITPPCLEQTVLNSMTPSSTTVNLGGAATFSWNASVPKGCTVQFVFAGQIVSRTGSLSVFPEYDKTYILVASVGSTTLTLATVSVNVLLPSTVYITRNDQQRLLAQAVGTANTTVVVTNNVDMNLTGYESIRVAGGVTLRGGRSARVDGARLYTTSLPGQLFSVSHVDNVRITALRFQGAEMGIGSGDISRCIMINASNNVLVDNNEIFGWTGVGVAVNDDDALNRIDYALNPETVKVRENFIHHNQYEGKFGYGVALGAGAYALIEKNVFDWNRHAIASNGRFDTGYRAYTNLVLEHGGYHRDLPIYGWTHTHQFDMHGTDNCGISGVFSDAVYNCGYGGHDVYLRGNSFFYTAAADFKLRGTPGLQPVGAFVYDNVFKHSSWSDAVQTTTGARIDSLGNLMGVNGMNEIAWCDLDGDGVLDKFLATGQSWWYSSGGTRPWSYLNTSKLRRYALEFGNFDAAAGCDVRGGGVVYSGGKPPSLKSVVVAPIGVLSL